MSSLNKYYENTGLLQVVFDRSEAGTILLDANGLILLVNARFEQITGYSKSQIEGKMSWKDFIVEDQFDDISRYLQLLKANPAEVHERIEVRFSDSNSKIKTAFLNAFLIENLKVIAISIVDITEQKEYEIALEKAKLEAENSERLKTAFLANMSHEIRTPINTIVGFADLLKMSGLTEEKRELYLKQVIFGSHDLLLLIEKVITVARLDSGQLHLNNREFNLNTRLKDIESRYKDELASREKDHIDLTFLPGKNDENFMILGDPIRLTEVISNLLENAIKFTDEGRIEFGYYFLEEEASEMDGEALLFFVKDSGVGIEKSKKNIIFDRFVKVIDKEEVIYKGAGLGLTICKEVVELFGGTIWVESTKGSGSRFFFNYPLGKNKIRKTAELQKETNPKAPMDWSDKEVLIAEDIESNYLYIKELLAPTNIRILRARDGLEAVDLFRDNPGIDIVVMDILMPGMDGYEATKEIRKIKPEIPVIAQSAFTFEGDIQDGLYAGSFNDYIMKPYTRKVLFAIIKKYFPE